MSGRLREVPVVTLRASEACHALGVSRNTFDRHIRDDLRWIRVGRIRMVAMSELQQWTERRSVRLSAEIDWSKEDA